MSFVSDEALARLRAIAELPELEGTRYRLVGELGRGGMGVVHEVEDSELQRHVAMKVLASELSTPADVERMRSEAQIVAGPEHPGIVPIYDVGLLPDGRAYYTMRLVRGTRLDEHGRDRSVNELLRIFTRVCEPVAFAHAAGIVHRDLKPDNVMVGDFGTVLVLDWGVASTFGRQEMVAGTPGYMPPEQLRGDPVDARADVFALGKLLDVLLSGTSGQVNRRLRAIVHKALSEQAQDRYADAVALRADVICYLDDEPVSAYRENVLERTRRLMVRYQAFIALIAAYLLMRAIVFLWFRL